MQTPNYKWIHFLIISILISAIVEFLLNWPISQVFNNSKQTYIIASLVFVVVLMIASSFIILFYVCFFGKISVISRLMSRGNVNKLFSMWHVHTADKGAYQTIMIFVSIQVLFLIYLMIRTDERTI